MDEAIVIDDDEEPKERRSAEAAQQQQGGVVTGSDCAICLEPYVEGGDHRAAVLKCGHFAGEPCLRKWVVQSKKCPTCRQRARTADIFPVFNLPTVLAVGGVAAAPPPAATVDPSEVAARELLLQKVQQKASAAELEAKRKAEEAQKHEREAKRLKRELDDTLQRMAALQQAAQVLAAAQPQAAPAASAGAQQQQQQHVQRPAAPAAGQLPPGWQQPPQAPDRATQQHTYGSSHQHGVALQQQHQQQHQQHQQHPSGGALDPALYAPPQSAASHGSTQQGAALGAAATRHHNYGPHQHPGVAPAPPTPAWGGPGTALAPHNHQRQLHPAPAGSMWGHFGDASQGTHQTHCHQREGYGMQPLYGTPAPPAAPSVPVGVGDRGGGASGRFERLFSVPVDGCRLLALDAVGSRILASESHGGGKASCVRKISMVSPESWTRIRLPPNAGIVLDLQLPSACPSSPGGPSAGCLAAVVTRGAGLCLLSPQSDSVVATFSGLPQRPSSCCWLPPRAAAGAVGAAATAYGEHLLVAGLEKGHLALLDIRRTDQPVAVAPVLQGDPRGCGHLPVRTVAALPPCAREPAAAAAAGGGGVLWPTVALSCAKGAWLLAGGGEAGAVGAAAPALLPLDGGFGGGGMQVESVAVYAAAGDEAAGGRVALSWRPADAGPAGGTAAAPGPRHEIGALCIDPQAPYRHMATVHKYSRRGIQAVRSCLLPGPSADAPPPYAQPHGVPQPPSAATAGGLLLASSDDDSRRPLIWSLGGGSGGMGPGAGAGTGPGAGLDSPCVAQWLDPHPEPPACMVAACGAAAGERGSAAADWFLGCASQSLVALYRRRGAG